MNRGRGEIQPGGFALFSNPHFNRGGFSWGRKPSMGLSVPPAATSAPLASSEPVASTSYQLPPLYNMIECLSQYKQVHPEGPMVTLPELMRTLTGAGPSMPVSQSQPTNTPKTESTSESKGNAKDQKQDFYALKRGLSKMRSVATEVARALDSYNKNRGSSLTLVQATGKLKMTPTLEAINKLGIGEHKPEIDIGDSLLDLSDCSKGVMDVEKGKKITAEQLSASLAKIADESQPKTTGNVPPLVFPKSLNHKGHLPSTFRS